MSFDLRLDVLTTEHEALVTRQNEPVLREEAIINERHYHTIKELKNGEGQTLKLVDARSIPAPACEVVDGGRALLAWEPGSYEVGVGRGGCRRIGFPMNHSNIRQMPLDGPWTLAFPEGWGAPAEVKVDALKAWMDLGLGSEGRAFSGTGQYTREFSLGALGADSCVELDLGRVEMVAKVTLNGKPVGTRWAQPYRFDVTQALKPGVNRLTVEVTSTWFNRLVYDAGRPEAERKTWTISGPRSDAALQPSGLLGPVVLRVGARVQIEDSAQ